MKKLGSAGYDRSGASAMKHKKNSSHRRRVKRGWRLLASRTLALDIEAITAWPEQEGPHPARQQRLLGLSRACIKTRVTSAWIYP